MMAFPLIFTQAPSPLLINSLGIESLDFHSRNVVYFHSSDNTNGHLYLSGVLFIVDPQSGGSATV